MTYYDKNLIVQFLDGKGDGIITAGSSDLKSLIESETGKDTVPIVTVPYVIPRPFGLGRDKRDELAAALGDLTTDSRLYLRGHGDWEQRTLGSWDAREVGGVLGGKLKVSPKLISVTGCRCARAVAPGAESNTMVSGAQRVAANKLLLEESPKSFVGLLHSRLQRYGITSPLVGRVFFVTVVGSDHRGNDGQWRVGQKITAISGDERNHRPYSKIRFDWVGEDQKAEWVRYS
ncbi:MAG: hypothetical protein KF850_25895 [Labilithrix sp.]|nr:hypothetical protein [Labilithrix sp.]